MNLWRPVRADPADWFSKDEIERSRLYNRSVEQHKFVSGLVQGLGAIGLIALRVPQRTFELLGVTNWVVQLLVTLVVTTVVLTVVHLPVDAAALARERRWGMTDQTSSGSIKRDLRELLLELPIIVAWLTPTYWVIRTNDYWWLWGGLVITAVLAVFERIFPNFFVAPSTHMTPIEDADLIARITKLGREAGLDVNEVFTVDASKQTRRDNVFFMGIGGKKRVVIFDNTLHRDPREIDVLVAHELGHWRRKHSSRYAAMFIATTMSIFVILGLLSQSELVLRLIGVDTFGDPASVVFFFAAFVFIRTTTSLVPAWFTRAFERQCDLDALEFTRDADAFHDAMHRMYTHNLKDLAPSRMHRVRASHPPGAERLEFGKLWRAQRIVTVLFTDIVGSTEIIEKVGDRRWFDMRREHDEIVRAAVKEHRGTEVDAAGDGFLIVFEDAGQALLCAQHIQREIAERTELTVRMGLHTGEVIRKDGAVVGRDVHVAARVSSIAEGGQILVSDAVREALAGADRFTFTNPREIELKGLSGTHVVHAAVNA